MWVNLPWLAGPQGAATLLSPSKHCPGRAHDKGGGGGWRAGAPRVLEWRCARSDNGDRSVAAPCYPPNLPAKSPCTCAICGSMCSPRRFMASSTSQHARSSAGHDTQSSFPCISRRFRPPCGYLPSAAASAASIWRMTSAFLPGSCNMVSHPLTGLVARRLRVKRDPASRAVRPETRGTVPLPPMPA